MNFRISNKYIRQTYFENVKILFFSPSATVYLYMTDIPITDAKEILNIKQFTQSVHTSEYKRVHALKGKGTLVMKILASRKRP